jgi:exonuclease SbcD
MKLLHLGDLHLGKSLGDFDLIDDQKYILDEIIDIIGKQSVDAVLIAGDVYDKSVPSEAATNLLDYFLRTLAKLKVKTFIISGNHDSDDRLGYGSSLFEANQIFISAKYNGTLYRQTLKDEYGDVNFYLLPFVKGSQVRHFFPDDKIETYDDAVRAVILHADIDEGSRNVLVSHQFVAGGADPSLGGSESMQVQSVGAVEKIGYESLKVFDYVALGHIHSPQRVGRNEVRYSGSPLKYSLSEVNNEKSVPVVTLGEKGKIDIELVTLKPKRDLRHIKGVMNRLLDKENVTDTDDFIYVTLNDEDVISDAMGIFQKVYPNTVKIDYDNSHTRKIEEIDITKITENKSFHDLVSDFYNMVYGCDISDDEMKVMMAVAKEAGVINEAD